MDLKEKAKQIRRTVLDMLYKAQTSHIGSNLSEIDILVALYYSVMTPDDQFVLSKGWGVAALYAILNDLGKVTDEELASYCQPGSKFIGLGEPIIPEIKFAGGSMGLGFPAAVGFALAKKIKKEPGRVFCLMSDGELNCGTTWEASLIAAHQGLDNLVVVVDKNGFQAMGKTEEVLKVDPKDAFPGWDWTVVNGHNMEALTTFLNVKYFVPRVIIAETTKGKGVPEMEGKLEWHYRNIPQDVYERAKETLE